jgi:hypothetical protein
MIMCSISGGRGRISKSKASLPKLVNVSFDLMDSYNPNPTVYAPSKNARRRSFGPSKDSSLWVSEYESDVSGDEDSIEPEPIDQTEIFGEQ